MTEYSTGQRIRLVSTDDPYTDLRSGDEGTVCNVDDAETVHVCWDRGSHLGMTVSDNPLFDRQPGEQLDVIEVIPGEAKFCEKCKPWHQ